VSGGELKAWKGQDSGRTTRMPGIYKFLLPEDELGNFLIFGWAKEVWVNVCYMSRGKIFFFNDNTENFTIRKNCEISINFFLSKINANLFFQIIFGKTKHTVIVPSYYIIRCWENDSDLSLKYFLNGNILK